MMKLQIRNENTFITLEVPEKDFTLMIETDYEERLAGAEDKTPIQRRTPQEIMDELNRAEYNSWHKYHRHADRSPKPPRMDGARRGLKREFDDGEEVGDVLDLFPDLSDEVTRERQYDYEATCQLARSALKPAHADIFIAVHLDGMSLKDYAAQAGIAPSTASEKLTRAEKKLKKYFEKHEF